MSEPFVSVVITGKNVNETIGECLQSLIHVKYPINRFEIIYVDAGSTDNTLSIVNRISENFQNFRYFIEPGLPGAGRNRGIKESRGEIIVFTDADCFVHESWIKNICFHLMKSDGQVVGVGGPSLTPPSDPTFAKYVSKLWETSFGSAGARNPAHYTGLRFVDHNPTCNSAYRRWIFEEIGLFDENLPVTEDVEFDTRIRQRGLRLLYTDDVIVWHHRKKSLNLFGRQMYSYGFWRAHSGKSQLIPLDFQHFASSTLLLYLIISPLLFLKIGSLFPVIPLVIYLAFGFASGIYVALKYRDPLSALVIPILGFFEHMFYGAGFISGLIRNKKVVR